MNAALIIVRKESMSFTPHKKFILKQAATKAKVVGKIVSRWERASSVKGGLLEGVLIRARGKIMGTALQVDTRRSRNQKKLPPGERLQVINRLFFPTSCI